MHTYSTSCTIHTYCMYCTYNTHVHSTYKHTLIKLAMHFDHVILLAGQSVDPLNVQPILFHQLNTADQKERERVAFCGDVGQFRAKVTLLWSSLFGLLGAFSPGGMGDVSWCVCVCVCVCVRTYICMLCVCMYVSLLHGTLHGLFLLPFFFLLPLLLLPLLLLLFQPLLSLHLLCSSLH